MSSVKMVPILRFELSDEMFRCGNVLRCRSAAFADEVCAVSHAAEHDVCKHMKIDRTDAADCSSGVGLAEKRKGKRLLQAFHKRRQRVVCCDAVHAEHGGACFFKVAEHFGSVMAERIVPLDFRAKEMMTAGAFSASAASRTAIASEGWNSVFAASRSTPLRKSVRICRRYAERIWG